VSRADVLGGQLAEATERPTEVSARAGTLAENLAVGTQCAVLASSLGVEILPPISPSEAGTGPAEGGNVTKGAAAPPADV
jgi:hypothetical protein